MAGPQFFTPQSVKPSRPKQRFTLAQANKSLPLVQRIVADIVQAHQSATQLQSKMEKTSQAKEQAMLQSELDKKLDRLNDYLDELADIGCELKDYRTGLIDFIGRHKGHDVCLCWKLGEEEIGFWHDLQTGFAGRQPVSTLDEQE